MYWPFRNATQPTTAPDGLISRAFHAAHTRSPHTFEHRFQASFPSQRPERSPPTRSASIYSDRRQIRRATSWRLWPYGCLDLIRHHTGQWWLKRPNVDGEHLIRNGFVINHRGELAGGVTVVLGVEPRLGSERTLTHADFTFLCDELAKGAESPLSLDLFYDALYCVMTSQGGKDIRRAVLDASTAYDVGVLAAASRAGERRGLSAGQILRALKSSDLLYNLCRGLLTLTGSRFFRRVTGELSPHSRESELGLRDRLKCSDSQSSPSGRSGIV